MTDPLGEVQSPPASASASPVPSFKDTAAGIVGQPAMPMPMGPAEMARQAAASMPMPNAEEYRLAQQRSADAQRDYEKKATEGAEMMAAKRDEIALAAEHYGEVAKRMLPQPMPAQSAPSRGLQPFLTPTKDEDPYTTVGKFMQAMTLFATMAGGGRNGARASISALTGALEGWREGARYKADAAYQTWKAETDNLFKQHDDEMRAYNSLMIAERVPLEQKLRALELSAWEHKNSMAAEAFKLGRADKSLEHLDKMRQAAIEAQISAAKIQGMKDEGDRAHGLKVQALDAQIDKTNRLLDAKAAEGVLKDAMAQRMLALKESESASKVAAAEAKAAKADMGKAPPEASQKVFRDVAQTDQKIGELMRLIDSPNVDINKIVGGIRPWVNSFIQRWGGGKIIPADATSGPVNAKLIKGKLTDDEVRFLALLQDYGDSVLRKRSGAAIGAVEMNRMLGFVADQAVSPQSVKVRLTYAREENLAHAEAERAMLRAIGLYAVPAPYQIPPITPQAAPGAAGPGGNDPLGIRK